MKKVDLTRGNIILSLLMLALPIMGTSFVQMAYNMTDLIWIGKLGSEATTAVGSAGFFSWFAMGLIMIPKVSAEALVSRAVGQKAKDTNVLVSLLIKFSAISGFVYSVVIFFGKTVFINFLNIDNNAVVVMAIEYSNIIAFTFVPFFLNPILSAIFNAYGSSFIPFLFNMCGLILNMVLDPVLIFGIIGKSNGVVGAATATLVSQLVVTLLFAFYIAKNKNSILFAGFKFFKPINVYKLKEILRIGIPVGLQSMAFTVIAVFIVRIIAKFGYVGIGVQKIGSQIEAVTWMTASGFSAAISAFIGQNFGAKKYARIKKGFWGAYILMAVVGTINGLLLIVFSKEIFGIFLKEPLALKEGANYLYILGFSQLPMCIEIVTNGAFYGLGKTVYPSVNSTLFTALRIPTAYVFSGFFGLSGVWWVISISSMIKGVVITILYFKKGSPEQISEKSFV